MHKNKRVELIKKQIEKDGNKANLHPVYKSLYAGTVPFP